MQSFRNARFSSTLLLGILVLPSQITPARAQPPKIAPEPDVPAVFGVDLVQVPKNAGQEQDAKPEKQDPKNATKQPEKGDTQANPLLKKLIQGLIPDPSGTKIIPGKDIGELIPISGDQANRDSIDALAPELTKLADAIQKARIALDDGREDQALKLLQQVLDFPEDSLVRLKSGQSISIRVVANRMLGRLRPEILERYRLKHDALARSALETAERDGSIKALADVATRFFHTEAGYEAANRLGTLHLDRGEFGMAARWYAQLIEAGTPLLKDPRWRLKAALAFREARNPELTQQILDQAVNGNPVEVGGEPVDFSNWLAGVPDLQGRASDPLADWTQMYGSASRRGRADGGEPVLLERWRIPLTENLPLEARLQELVRDLNDQQRVTVPAWFPTLVGGRVAFPTLRGIRVLDAESGEPLWSSRTELSAEKLLTDQSKQGGNGYRMINGRLIKMYSSRSQAKDADSDPLTSLLFRNGNYGLTSSNGRSLFIVEDLAIIAPVRPGYSNGRSLGLNDPFRRNWSTNKLTAYDLQSGRPKWEIGGTRLDEPFDLPLAGNFFFGAPAIDGDTLFIIGENEEREIRVFSIDALSGKPRWSQLIGYSDTEIASDLVRRWWTAQVGVDAGIVVCPTSVGWLVAVDRLNHSLLWAHRYSRPGATKPTTGRPNQSSAVSFASLNSRWAPSAPIVAGGKVLYSPPEEPTLVCLDLLTGEKLWQFPKQDYLYVAGVDNDRVLLVGNHLVVALSIETGTAHWSTALTSDDGQPSGRSILGEKHLLLPVSSNQLLRIALEDGKVTARLPLPRGSRPLGNLSMYRGLLLSLGIDGITAYEQRDTVETQIADRQQNDPNDARALLLQAALARLNRDDQDALNLLRKIQPDDLDSTDREKHRRFMFRTLSEQIREDSESRHDLLTELKGWCRTPDELLDHQLLRSELAVRDGKLVDALTIYLELARANQSKMIPNGRERVDVELSAWLEGRLLDLWNDSDESQKTEFTSLIDGLQKELRNEPVRWHRLLAFHPRIQSQMFDRAQNALKQNRMVDAELLLERLDLWGNAEQQAGLRALMVRHLTERGLEPDAEVLLQELESSFADQTLPDGQTVAAFASATRSAADWENRSQNRAITWSATGVDLVMSGPDYSVQNNRHLDSNQMTSPALQGLRFELQQQYNRLTVSRSSNDEVIWSLPLRGDQSQTALPQLHETGHGMVFLYKNSLYLISPLNRRIIWSTPVDVHVDGQSSRYSNGMEVQRKQFHSGTSLLRYASLLTKNNRQGPRIAVGSSFVVHETRRGFSCVDLASGNILWKHQGLAGDVQLRASENYVYLIPADRRKAQVLRGRDGKAVPAENIGELMAKSTGFVGDSLVLLESVSGFNLFGLGGGQKSQIRCLNPFTQETQWTLKIPSGTSLSKVSEHGMMTLDSDGILSRINLQQGQLNQVGKLPSSEMKGKSSDFAAIADHHHLYIFGANNKSQSFYSEVSSIIASDRIWCLNRTTGEVLWSQPIKPGNLILEQLSHSPLMVLAIMKHQRRGAFGFSTMQLTALDKRTGNTVVEEKVAPNGFRAIAVNMQQRFVEIQTYNSRLRMKATDRLKADSK